MLRLTNLFVALILIFILFSIGACNTTGTENTRLQEEVEIKENKIEDLEKQIAVNEEETVPKEQAKFSVNLLEEAFNKLSKAEIREVGKKFYEYELLVEDTDKAGEPEWGKSIPGDGKLTLNTNDFIVRLSAISYFYPFLTDNLDEDHLEIIREADIERGEIKKHKSHPETWWKVKTENIDYEYKHGAGTVMDAFSLHFSDVPRGETVVIEIIPELQQWLDLETNRLEIKIKPTNKALE